jgi:Domain of unknown function (DUF4384)
MSKASPVSLTALGLMVILTGNPFSAFAAEPGKIGARDIFLKDKATGKTERMAGQFVLQLVEGNQSRRVSLDYAFKTGDEFQLVVTPSRNAYLYVINVNPKGEVNYVWPAEAKHDSTNNKISKGAETLVPASGSFEFGGTTGDDWLLLILSPIKQLPHLGRIRRDFNDYQQAPGRVVEYPEIHSPPKQFGARGKPGLTEKATVDDPATYGAQSGDGERVLVYPYLMRHQRKNGDTPESVP